MIINDQIIFDTFFYLTLGVSLIFGFLSLLLYRNRRRMIFLFLFYALLSLVEFLLFSGVMVFIIGLIFTSFYILLLVFSYNEDVFSAIKKKKSKRGPWEIAARVTNLVAGLAICIGTGYWFYVFTESNIGEIRDIKNFNFTSIDSILTQLFENYIFVVMVIAIGLFLAIVWFAALTEREKIKRGERD